MHLRLISLTKRPGFCALLVAALAASACDADSTGSQDAGSSPAATVGTPQATPEDDFRRYMRGTFEYDAQGCWFVDPESKVRHGFRCGFLSVGVAPSTTDADLETTAAALQGTVSTIRGDQPWRVAEIAIPVGTERAALQAAREHPEVLKWAQLILTAPVSNS